jgi:hypothetical protein
MFKLGFLLIFGLLDRVGNYMYCPFKDEWAHKGSRIYVRARIYTYVYSSFQVVNVSRSEESDLETEQEQRDTYPALGRVQRSIECN